MACLKMINRLTVTKIVLGIAIGISLFPIPRAQAESPTYSVQSGQDYFQSIQESCTCSGADNGKTRALAEDVLTPLTPFPAQCMNSPWLTNRPDGKKLQCDIPTHHDLPNQAGTIRTKDVLIQVLAKLRAYNDLNKELNNEFLDCLASKRVRTTEQTEVCRQNNEYVDHVVPAAVHQARYHLGRAFSKTLTNSEVDVFQNYRLDPFYTYRGMPWKPMDKQEVALAQADLDAIMQESRQAWKYLKNQPGAMAAGGQRAIYTNRLLESGAEHFEKYQNILTENPYMMYMPGGYKTGGKGNQTDTQRVRTDFVSALKALNKNIAEDERKLDDIEKQLMAGSDEIPSEALDLMLRKGIVKGMMTEDPKLCGIFSSLEEARTTRGRRDDKVVTGALTALSFFGPGILIRGGLTAGRVVLASTALNTAGAYAYVYRDCSRRNRALLRNAKTFDATTDPTGNGQTDVAYNQERCQDSIALTPVFTAGGEAIGVRSFLNLRPRLTNTPSGL